MRSRTLVPLVALAVALTACTPRSTTPPTTAPPSTRSRPAILLTTRPGAAIKGWSVAIRIPFGSGRDHLGFSPLTEGLNGVPTAFTVMDDGSFWIVDAMHERLAHFSSDARFLGETKVGRHAVPADLVQVAGTLVGLQRGSMPDARMWTWTSSGGRSSDQIELEGDAVQPQRLVSGAPAAIGDVTFKGWVGIDPRTGAATLLPGLLLASGVQMDLRGVPGEGDRLVATIVADGIETQTPIVFDPQPAEGAVVVGADVEAIETDALIAYVRVSAGETGSVWCLTLSDSGAVTVWERLPSPTIGDENQVRHLSVGSDGTLYLMVPSARGITIYRHA